MSEILNHLVKGEGRSLALLLIHPLGAELSFWDDFVEKIGDRFTTVACDLRSSGKSFGTGAPPSLADHAADLEALRLDVGVKNVVPIGCAVGSMIAAAYAGSYPSSTAALILANPTPSSSPQARLVLTERAAVVARHGMTAILPAAVERAFFNQPKDARYERYYCKFEAQNARAYALSTLGAANADATEFLKTVRCPALLMAGRHDVLLPLDNARAVHALLPQSEFVIAEHAAHFVPFQSPECFAETACQWLCRKIKDDVESA
ncbi:alpha/beta hydrolase [Mesorhizobium sp. BR1-1-9]|uniref:alpha/beta fold hydrolase n=1 Tax=Mesorhizobium sp. BR1-1-9 TaxID=2876646 RepID=UPI001CD0D7A1|nr:alpha/beta hydrolase [Mesorhizobium sp. BR1-1-9]MBZ9870424.1 alpha/beta hydrolase [Mesorhizobium sp. BR1-1-9]